MSDYASDEIRDVDSRLRFPWLDLLAHLVAIRQIKVVEQDRHRPFLIILKAVLSKEICCRDLAWIHVLEFADDDRDVFRRLDRRISRASQALKCFKLPKNALVGQHIS